MYGVALFVVFQICLSSKCSARVGHLELRAVQPVLKSSHCGYALLRGQNRGLLFRFWVSLLSGRLSSPGVYSVLPTLTSRIFYIFFSLVSTIWRVAVGMIILLASACVRGTISFGWRSFPGNMVQSWHWFRGCAHRNAPISANLSSNTVYRCNLVSEVIWLYLQNNLCRDL